ncbi:MAG TPA: HIT family protein [Candidatus Paceibacterota bacterium]|nr:HIT family protein [Candidatus Paceibacterota bacterium]
MDNCIFCKIVRKEAPATVVYEDDATLGFLSIGPNAPGHTLVIPKVHARNILDMDEASLGSTMTTVQKVSAALMRGLDAEGVNVIFNNEPAAHQIIFHTHAHVIPRKTGDGLHYESPEHTYGTGEAEMIAAEIRSALG